MNSAPEMFLVFIIKNVSYPFLKIHIILCLLSSHLTDLLVFFYCVPGTVPGARDIVVNKTILPALIMLIAWFLRPLLFTLKGLLELNYKIIKSQCPLGEKSLANCLHELFTISCMFQKSISFWKVIDLTFLIGMKLYILFS